MTDGSLAGVFSEPVLFLRSLLSLPLSLHLHLIPSRPSSFSDIVLGGILPVHR